ncbi:MAG: hypothetical protein JWM57_4100, partial [Phycisphaerales bacterium]|nr:hypothetical protein [Phycisphaerales bacterium]
GTYTVTLKLWNEKMGYKATSITINVAPANRSTIFVSNSGSDGNSGTSAGSAVTTAARAFALAKGKSNVDILFSGGSTFSVSKGLLIGGSNIRVGSYGNGKATLKWTGPRNGNAILTIVRGSVGCIVENLNFDDIYPGPSADRSGIPVGVDVIGAQNTLRNLTFLNIGYAIQTNKLPTGVMVQSCDSPTLYGLRNYLVWCQGTDFVLLGNKVANSTNEHPIRVFGVDRLLIAYNDLANPQAYSWETSKTAMNIQKGNDVYIYGNTIRGPRVQIGPLGGADGINDKGARLTDVVIENNKFDNTIVQMYTGAQNVYYRNNIWDYSNNDALMLEGYSSTYGRGIVNVNIINNTFVNSGTQGGVIDVEGSVAGIKMVNNIYKATSLSMGSKGTAAVYAVDMSAFNSFTSITNNIWAIPANYPTWLASHTTGKVFALIGVDQANTNNYYNIDRWNALSQVGTDTEANVSLNGSYTPTSILSVVATAAKNYAGVFGDFSGDPRSLTGTWSIGAVQV